MTVKTGKKLEGFTPGPWHMNVSAKYPVYAGESPNHVLIAHTIKGPNDEANAALIAQAPTLLEQRDKLRDALAGIAESAESAFDEVSDQTAAGRAARRIFERISKRAERVLREVEDGQ